jgi:hypothetical protein
MGDVIPFRPRSLGPWTGGVTPVTGPLTDTELVRVEELLTEARSAKLAGQRRRELPTVFTTGGAADEPMLPCPLTDVSWLDEL